MNSNNDAPVLLEAFTDPLDESDSLEMMVGLDKDYNLKGKAYNFSERVLSKERLKKLRRSLKK